MWARRCGAPRRWPSRIKVLIFTLLDGGIGLSIYLYMAGSNISYLDLEKPHDGNVLCLTEWPPTGHGLSWSDPKDWFKWWRDHEDHRKILEHKKCKIPSVQDNTCSESSAPLKDMAQPIASAMQGNFDNLRFDILGLSARIFLTLGVFICLGMVVHDLALIGTKKKNLILDVTGVNQHCPVIRQVWRCLAGVRLLKRILGSEEGAARVLGIVVVIVLAPVFVAWNLVVFNFVIGPILLMAFARYPVRMCRAWVFITCITTFLYGIALTCLSLGFAGSSPAHRPYYAVTWEADNAEGIACTCGCDFPVATSVCINLSVIGIGTALKSLFVALRCLKGLRRSQWANLLSVVFPVPLTVYTVDWKQPDGNPIKFRDETMAVQEEVAFDPFAMMDEQLDSASTTVDLHPEPSMKVGHTPSGRVSIEPTRLGMEAPGISTNNLHGKIDYLMEESFYVGCCGFPWPTGGKKGFYNIEELDLAMEQDSAANETQPLDLDEAEETKMDPSGNANEAPERTTDPSGSEGNRPFWVKIDVDGNANGAEEPPEDPQHDGRGTSNSQSRQEGPVPQPNDELRVSTVRDL